MLLLAISTFSFALMFNCPDCVLMLRLLRLTLPEDDAIDNPAPDWRAAPLPVIVRLCPDGEEMDIVPAGVMVMTVELGASKRLAVVKVQEPQVRLPVVVMLPLLETLTLPAAAPATFSAAF